MVAEWSRSRQSSIVPVMTVTDSTGGDLYYDPIDAAIDAEAHGVWKRLRDEAPLYWNEKYEFFAISRYDDVLRAILDTDTFSSAHGTTIDMMSPERIGMKMMIFMDPPEHSWHRKVVKPRVHAEDGRGTRGSARLASAPACSTGSTDGSSTSSRTTARSSRRR